MQQYLPAVCYKHVFQLQAVSDTSHRYGTKLCETQQWNEIRHVRNARVISDASEGSSVINS